MTKFKHYIDVFLTMLKIGLFTFGGGYAMIALLESELVNKKKWIEGDEFLKMVEIAEATPGPLAINMATFVGYKRGKFLGSLLATLGVVIPSFVIVFLISLYFDKFLEIKLIESAFKGIKVCVVFLIIFAGIKLLVKLEKNLYNVILFLITFLLFMLFSILGLNVSSLYFILASILIGIISFLVSVNKTKKEAK